MRQGGGHDDGQRCHGLAGQQLQTCALHGTRPARTGRGVQAAVLPAARLNAIQYPAQPGSGIRPIPPAAAPASPGKSPHPDGYLYPMVSLQKVTPGQNPVQTAAMKHGMAIASVKAGTKQTNRALAESCRQAVAGQQRPGQVKGSGYTPVAKQQA
jgi:hypothetical protein